MPYEVIYSLEGALKIRRHPGRALTSKLHLQSSLQVHHEATELDLKGVLDEEEELRSTLLKLQRNLTNHIELMEDAWEKRYISVAIGYQLTIKNLRIELAVRFRDLNQKDMNVLEVIRTTHHKLSTIEFDIVRTEVRLCVIESQLRPVSSLGNALQRPPATKLAARGPPPEPA
ncbi:hypothetical protein SLS64_009596 [Diaporthe eres]